MYTWSLLNADTNIRWDPSFHQNIYNENVTKCKADIIYMTSILFFSTKVSKRKQINEQFVQENEEQPKENTQGEKKPYCEYESLHLEKC